MDLEPAPVNINLRMALASVDICFPRPSGTVISFHFATESANIPNGAATSEIAFEPNPDNVLIKLPKATSPRAEPIAVRPLPISSQDIPLNSFKA